MTKSTSKKTWRKSTGKRTRPKNSKSRSRPNKADFQFPLSFSFTKGARGVVGPINLVVFALAMHWGFRRNRVRLQMMQNLIPGTKIITVSESHDTVRPSLLHLDHDFSRDRGHRRIASRIAEERALYPGARILVVMDYYFLPVNYISERYGDLWLDTGVHRLLCGGADEVILPYDDGEFHMGQSSCMAAMLDGNCHSDVKLDFVPLGHNPLWVATNSPEIEEFLASFHGGCNQEATSNYLKFETPFVSATLIG